MIALLQDIKDCVGYEVGLSSWITVDSDMIEGFAHLTGNRPLAPETDGQVIAQGQLILSLLPRMIVGEVTSPDEGETAISYGFDRVRFLTPVPAGSQVRGRFVLTGYEQPRPGVTRLNWDVTVEIRGSKTPALVARWSSMRLPSAEAPGAAA